MVQFSEIKKAQEYLKGKIIRTPLFSSEYLGEQFGAELFFKLENLQRTGAFKVRGVTWKIASLSPEERKQGVICATSGNHGLGVAYVAYKEGIDALVVIPEHTPSNKQEALAKFAPVHVEGATYFESHAYALNRSIEEKRTFIHSFDDPRIIEGQGTMGLEIAEDLPDADIVVSPVGGGGLISGLLIALKEQRPEITVIGVQAEGSPSMYRSREAGVVQTLPDISTIAEGIAVKRPGDLTFSIVDRLVDDIVLVSDEEIAFAAKTLFKEMKVVAEFAGAASLAAVMAGKISCAGKRVACIVSGGNVSEENFALFCVPKK